MSLSVRKTRLKNKRIARRKKKEEHKKKLSQQRLESQNKKKELNKVKREAISLLGFDKLKEKMFFDPLTPF